MVKKSDAAEADISSPLPTELAKYTIEWTRGMKGQYGWTCKVRADSREEGLDEVAAIDAALCEHFQVGAPGTTQD